jgi:hypothetical protein
MEKFKLPFPPEIGVKIGLTTFFTGIDPKAYPPKLKFFGKESYTKGVIDDHIINIGPFYFALEMDKRPERVAGYGR